MKGIILSGGNGTRLYPATKTISKQILPVFDKPMIYYPLSTLMLLGIIEIYIISSPSQIKLFEILLGDGKQIGLKIHYIIQTEPRGLVDAFLLTQKYINSGSVCLILGDNIFYGQDFINSLISKTDNLSGALITGYRVKNPQDFGVVEFDQFMNVVNLEEKPLKPKSNFAIPGLYFYDYSVFNKATQILPSSRGELEITDLNNLYLQEKKLSIHLLGRGVAWLDTGSPESLLEASEFVALIQKRQGLYIACIEEIAWRKGFIDLIQLEYLGNLQISSDYGKYILNLVSSMKRGES